MKNLVIVLSSIILFGLFACTQKQPQAEKTMLFNGTDLSGWKLFIPGDSVDVNTVWSVKDAVVLCVGQPNGYMMTQGSYSNYKLHLEWRWPAEPGNSGVLLHCEGPDQVWPNTLECQLKSGNAGDFVLIGGGQITVDDSTYINEGRFLSIPKKHEGIEKPAGEWNTYDIQVRGGSVACYVNGIMQNNGVNGSHTAGPIALQAEGAPIEFRNIYITAL